MGFLNQVFAAATNIKVPKDMSLWERIQPPIDISKNGHLIDYLFNYTTILVIIFFDLFSN